MRYLVTGKQMKQIDRETIENIGIPSVVLMERAALSVVEEVEQRLKHTDRIRVACGCGNNGADGIAIGRILHLKGYSVEIIFAGEEERGSAEWKLQLGIARELEIPVFSFQDFIPGPCDVLIDAVFGVGLDRNVGGEYRELLEMMVPGAGRSPRFVAAVDIPSGIHSDTGAVMGIAVKADLTVTFGLEKLGTSLYPGKEYAGKVLVKDIGFPDLCVNRVGPVAFTYQMEDLKRIPEREADSNKGSFGKVLIAAGSKGMAGAAYLSGLAAYRTGAGLVKILTVEENRQVLQQLLPEAIITVYEEKQILSEPEKFTDIVSEQCRWADVTVVGPGIGTDDCARVLTETILSGGFGPVVADADALNILAKYPELTRYLTEETIITPHPGELARLAGRSVLEIKRNLPDIAREYSRRYGITCVAKDAATVVACRDGRLYINSSGNSAMAKAGSGDVLTGIISGLLALGLDEPESACLGVYLHGLAGDRARTVYTEHGVLARNLTEYIPGREWETLAEADKR